MDVTRHVACNEGLINPVLTMGMQVSCILVLSHFFQIALKPLGQPGPVAQILAGFVIGPSGFSRIRYIRDLFFQNQSGDYYETVALFARIIIMFVIGLEMDIPCLMRNLRPATTIACGGCLTGTIFAAAITSFVCQSFEVHDKQYRIFFMLAVVFTNSSSPIVIRMAAEMKFATSDIGRLAISSSLIGDTYSVVLFVLMSLSKNEEKDGNLTWVFPFIFKGLALLGVVFLVIVLNMYLANWLNRRNRDQKYLKNAEVFAILSLIVATALTIETFGFNSIVACFIMGSMFPRGGKTARTLVPKLSYCVHNFILPIYFGYTGFLANVDSLNSLLNAGIAAIVILLSLGSKISGTLMSCHYLKIPLSDGVFLAFLMNMKGHIDLLTITFTSINKILDQEYYGLMMTTLALNSLIIGPIITLMVRRESEALGYKHISFECQDPESELRVLACVHSPRPVSTMLGLIAASRGSHNIPVAPYLLHLIELPEKKKTNLLYHQREDDELSDDEDYGGNDVLEINDNVDTFTAETGVMVHQVKAVSAFTNMHIDVSERAEDIRAAIIFLPFHKHQRIDGKMESGKEGIRTTNQKILRHVQCSVAILVDRGLTGASQASGSESLQHVAILFFGGPDDREALGFSRRLGMYHHINLTVIRFLPASTKERNVGVNVSHKEEDVLMAISDQATENEADSAVLADFYNRYVTSGQVGYVEKQVENGGETASALRDMADMYSLFIVGKGGRGHSPLTTGMSDWEECPELGTVGDLLASSDFDISGSVLVIQQYRPSQNEDDH